MKFMLASFDWQVLIDSVLIVRFLLMTISLLLAGSDSATISFDLIKIFIGQI